VSQSGARVTNLPTFRARLHDERVYGCPVEVCRRVRALLVVTLPSVSRVWYFFFLKTGVLECGAIRAMAGLSGTVRTPPSYGREMDRTSLTSQTKLFNDAQTQSFCKPLA
jgi:hypothetical protein